MHINGSGNCHVVESVTNTANPICDHIFVSSFKAQRRKLERKLERVFSLKRGKRDVRAVSFEL